MRCAVHLSAKRGDPNANRQQWTKQQQHRSFHSGWSVAQATIAARTAPPSHAIPKSVRSSTMQRYLFQLITLQLSLRRRSRNLNAVAILSVDLAFRRWSDLGIVILDR